MELAWMLTNQFLEYQLYLLAIISQYDLTVVLFWEKLSDSVIQEWKHQSKS